MRYAGSWFAAAALLVSATACGHAETSGTSDTSASSGTSAPKANGLIAFSQWGDDYGPLFVVRPDGGGLRRLTPAGGGEDGFPEWSPDGKELAFLRGENFLNAPDASRADVYVLKPAQGSPRRLTKGLITFNYAWSPDSKRIAYAAKPADGSDATRVYVMNADGGGAKSLTGPLTDGPAWSPDGRRIAFLAIPSSLDQSNVYVMAADGSDQAQLTHKMVAESLAWSPDGRRIAFRDRDVRAIAVVDADGSNFHRLTGEGTAEADFASGGPALGPYWSPDGKQIAFAGKGNRVYVMKGDGSGLRPLTQRADYLQGLAWSPDGRKLAYVAVRSLFGPYESDIHVTNADGSGDRRLRNGIDETGLSWQPLPPS